MVHLPELIQDLALILAAAGIVTLIFKKLKQPIVLGYILAGLFVGPHFTFFPTITEISSIHTWAEIGIIFLLFTLGLEFSFKKLARVGGAASITAVIEVLFMVTAGFFTGRLFGWSDMDSLFLGGILAISSTTIILRAFDELGVRNRGFVSLVFGVLVVEDLVAILLLVLLSTVAIGKSFAGHEILYSVVKLFFFLVLWFLSGIFLLPSFLKRIKPLMDNETLLVVSISLCLIMVVIATAAGFSAALGAFIMGSILAETNEGENIVHLLKPVKDLFAAVFFVSVGMLIEPKVILDHGSAIAVITVVTILGKTLSTAAGALMSGQSLRHSVQAGMSLAQIGEFSFIIAGLGLTLDVTSDFLYPVAVGVSTLTTFTTPYMIRSADRVCRFFEKQLPVKTQDALKRFSVSTQTASARNEWTQFIRKALLKIIIHGVLIVAVFLFVDFTILPFLESHLSSGDLIGAFGLLIGLVLSAPFIWALTLGPLEKENRFNTSDYRVPLFVFEILRLIVFTILLGALSSRLIGLQYAVGFSLIFSLGLVTLFAKRLSSIYEKIENRFIQNLNEQSVATGLPQLAPWDAHLAQLKIPAESHLVGRSLSELAIREKLGVTIALIQRGRRFITAPHHQEKLYPHDQIAIIGTDEQIGEFKKFIENTMDHANTQIENLNYTLQAVRVDERSEFCGRTIRESGIREQTNGLVVGIERRSQRILNPDSQLTIEPGDLLWIVGETDLILTRAKS